MSEVLSFFARSKAVGQKNRKMLPFFQTCNPETLWLNLTRMTSWHWEFVKVHHNRFEKCLLDISRRSVTCVSRINLVQWYQGSRILLINENRQSIKAYLKFCKITKTPHWVPQDIEEINAVCDDSFEIGLYDDAPSNTDDFSRPFYEVQESTPILMAICRIVCVFLLKKMIF